MKKVILSVIFLLAAFGGFFGYVDGKYQETKELRLKEKKYDGALQNSKNLLEARDGLLSKYNTFETSNVEKLENLLPGSIDNINLILEIDKIASRNLLMVDNISVKTETDESQESDGRIASSEVKKYNYVDISFSTVSNYERIVDFVEDLSKSLRIIDIRGMTFDANENDAYRVSFKIRTYWLKN